MAIYQQQSATTELGEYSYFPSLENFADVANDVFPVLSFYQVLIVKQSVIILLLATSATVAAQSSPPTNSEVVLVELAKPEYPILARTVNIWGQVKVEVRVAKNSTVESAVALSGHPMLKVAAVASAKQSRFECRACAVEMSYVLVYAYELHDGEDCCSALTVPAKVEQQPPSTNQQGEVTTRVVITGEHNCLCDPAITVKKKVRSPKCLYLWKCSET